MLTGGYLPLAATLTNQKIYDSYLGSYQDMKHFFHGHTFTGNPLACATALTNLELYDKNNLISKNKIKSKQFQRRVSEISNLDIVGDVLYKGMLMSIELVRNKNKQTPISPDKTIHHKIV